MAGGAELSASMAEGVGGRGRAQGEGETVAELTTVAGERGELGEGLEQAGRRGGSPVAGVENELGAASPGRASARGPAYFM